MEAQYLKDLGQTPAIEAQYLSGFRGVGWKNCVAYGREAKLIQSSVGGQKRGVTEWQEITEWLRFSA